MDEAINVTVYHKGQAAILNRSSWEPYGGLKGGRSANTWPYASGHSGS